MYQRSYAEVLEDDQSAARQIEAQALDKVVSLLRIAAATRPASKESVEALYVTRQLWTILMQDLAAPTNALPVELRASMISIGIWILKETDAIRLGQSANYAGVADICAIIRDGLR